MCWTRLLSTLLNTLTYDQTLLEVKNWQRFILSWMMGTNALRTVDIMPTIMNSNFDSLKCYDIRISPILHTVWLHNHALTLKSNSANIIS